MTNKTTKTLFTKEFLDNLNFLTENWNAVENYENSVKNYGEGIVYYERGCTLSNDYYNYELELQELAEKFEYLFEEVKQQIDDYFNTDFTELFDFIYKNRNTNYCDLEVKLIECLEAYMAD